MNEEAKKDRGKKEGRSPGYPAVSMAAALERARTVMEKEKRHWVPLSTIFGHWGYGPKSSMGILLLAALKKYGLVEYKGSGDSREARITDLAWRILVDERPVSPERDGLIQEAALSPVIHQKLWNEYKGQLPSDENLKHRLVTEEGFTTGAVDDFVRQFRATISFAKLGDSDSLSGHDEDKSPSEEEIIMPETRPLESPKQQHVPGSAQLGPDQEFKVKMSEGMAYLRVPHILRREDWEKIQKLLEVIEPVNE